MESRRPSLRARWSRWTFVAAAVALWAGAADGEARLVRDINPQAEPATSNPTALQPFGQALILIADDGAHGRELWRSDGTAAGTILLADAVPRDLRDRNEPRPLTTLGDRLYFGAGKAADAPLWQTDGTPRGTRRVAAGPPYAPRAATEWNGISYYFDDDGEQVGFDLWRSDGTPDGTYLVAELADADTDTRPVGLANHIYFFAGDAQHGMELWRSDGTAAGTGIVRDLAPGPQSGWPGPGSAEIVANDEYLAFIARTGEGRPLRIWRSDGTRAGTVPLSPPTLSEPTMLTVLGMQVFFVAHDAPHGYELWRSNGTMRGTAVVADIEPGAAGTGFGQLLAAGNRLLFIAWTEAYGGELWQSDGTAPGTRLVLDVRPGAADAVCRESERPIALAAHGVVMAADDGVHGCEPWLIDVDRGTGTVVDLLASGASDPRGLSTVGDAVLFAAAGTPGDRELWRSDGTVEGTYLVRDIRLRTASSYPGEFVVTGSRVVFTADDGLHGREPWASDGTAPGTVLIRDFLPGPTGVLWLGSAPVGDAVVFGIAEASGPTIWRSDGTAAGSERIFRLPPSLSGRLHAFVAAGAVAYFADDSGLWLTDGMPEGTRLVKSGVGIDSLSGAAVVDDVLYFAGGGALMRSDGSAAGTTVVRPAGSGPIGRMAAAGGTLYFRKSDGAHGAELWRSDGTSAGTRLVRDINSRTEGAGTASSAPGSLTPVGERLFFIATDGVHGREPWVTDGSAEGTRLLADINPGPNDSAEFEPYYPVTGSADGLFYLIARNQLGWPQLWRSDGTAEGTFLLLERTALANLTEVRGRLIFAAPARDDTNTMGLWRSDGTLAGTVPIALIGSSGSGVEHFGAFAVARERLFFTVSLPNTGSESWSMPIGAAICAGDLDGDHRVSIAELTRGVAAALDIGPTPGLGTLDIDADQRISVAELVAAVANALASCSIA